MFVSRRRHSGIALSLASQVATLLAGFSGPKLWLDPRDKSTLQQDAAGATPVTAAGDPIGRIMDKSGAANHATQTTAASRPLWQTTYAGFDGTDDSWTTASINFTSTDKVSVIAGVRKLSDAALGVIAELGSVLPVGSFLVSAPFGASATYGTSARGLSAGFGGPSAASFAAPNTAVLTDQYDLAGGTGAGQVAFPPRINGVPSGAGPVAAAAGGTFGNYPLFVGRRTNSSLPFNGNLYGLIIIGRLLTAPELTLCEQYMAQQAGVSF